MLFLHQVRFSLCINMVLILFLAFLVSCCKNMSLTICHNSTIYLNSDSHAVLSLSQSRIREILYTIKNRSVIGESRISPDNRRNAVCVTWGLTWGELVGYLEKTWKYLGRTFQLLGWNLVAAFGQPLDHLSTTKLSVEGSWTLDSHDVRQCHAWVKHHKLASLGISNFWTFW